MSNMIRKHIYLPKDLDQRIHMLAQQQQKPEAEVIRDLLESGIAKRQTTSTGAALLRLADLGKDLDIRLGSDASSRIDDDLYGANA